MAKPDRLQAELVAVAREVSETRAMVVDLARLLMRGEEHMRLISLSQAEATAALASIRGALNRALLAAAFTVALLAPAASHADDSVERRERRELQREMDRANDRFYGAPQREREHDWRRQMPGTYDYQPPRYERDGR
jgi:hypothetical protein